MAKQLEKCDECENGRWYDASHGCSRHCNKCDGTGKMPVKKMSRPNSIAEQLEILRRIAERGKRLAEIKDSAHLDLWIHTLDEIKRTRKWLSN